MRISELARRAGVALPTVKYYLSAGLLPAGHRTAPNQADYGERHLYRLELIRTLLEIGGLSIARTHAVLRAVDAGVSLTALLGVLDEAGPGQPRRRPAPDPLAGVVATAARLDVAELGPALDGYAEAAARLAACDAEVVRAIGTRMAATPGADRGMLLERIVAAVVLGQAAETALRGPARRHALRP
ncbi:MerR family transcriptional regulator [Symbioplanes lichenis]|uniref:MerR family transcriptional regulator n=1 Tax=Symbioplanes lichenis TaxID=1629072 RepID=UPI00273894CE|nr:MerR family transcriptional regulator [Actinoplanes lichenis]